MTIVDDGEVDLFAISFQYSANFSGAGMSTYVYKAFFVEKKEIDPDAGCEPIEVFFTFNIERVFQVRRYPFGGPLHIRYESDEHFIGFQHISAVPNGGSGSLCDFADSLRDHFPLFRGFGFFSYVAK